MLLGADISEWVEEAIARGGLGPEGDQVGEETVAAEVAMMALVNLLRTEQGLGEVEWEFSSHR